MPKVLRAKFRVEKVDRNEEIEQSRVKMTAVQSDENLENQDFNKATPYGDLEMFIDNPKAKDFFIEAKEYYLDFTLCND